MGKEGTIEIFFHDDARGKEVLYEIRNCLIDAGFKVGVVRSVNGKNVSITEEGVVVQEKFFEPVAVRICIPFAFVVEEGFDSFLKKSKAGSKFGTMLGDLVLLNTHREGETAEVVVGVTVQFYDCSISGRVRWWQFIFHILSQEDINIAIQQTFYALSAVKESFDKIYIDTIKRIVFSFDDTKKRWRVSYIGKSKDVYTGDVSPAKNEKKYKNGNGQKIGEEHILDIPTQRTEPRFSWKELFLVIFPPKMFFGIINPFRDIKMVIKFFYKGISERHIGTGVFVLFVICMKWGMVATIFCLMRLIL
ncbi:MAG: hypothetical protein V1652_01125 [bacterium]